MSNVHRLSSLQPSLKPLNAATLPLPTHPAKPNELCQGWVPPFGPRLLKANQLTILFSIRHMPDPKPKRASVLSQAARSAILISLFYAAMSLLALGLIVWRSDSFHRPPLRLLGPSWPLDLAIACVTIITVHLATRILQQRWQRLRRATRDIVSIFGQLSPAQIASIAIASGIGEELLFRAYLLNETGLWISSLVFGLIHVPPNRRWRLWPIFAFFMGLLLGALYLHSHAILPPILLHVGINYLNLRLCLRIESKQKGQV